MRSHNAERAESLDRVLHYIVSLYRSMESIRQRAQKHFLRTGFASTTAQRSKPLALTPAMSVASPIGMTDYIHAVLTITEHFHRKSAIARAFENEIGALINR